MLCVITLSGLLLRCLVYNIYFLKFCFYASILYYEIVDLYIVFTGICRCFTMCKSISWFQVVSCFLLAAILNVCTNKYFRLIKVHPSVMNFEFQIFL